MARIAPPPPLRVALDDNDGRFRLRFGLWQVWVTVLTVLATAWLFKLSPILGILALVTAKHVLVALLVMGHQVNRPPQADG